MPLNRRQIIALSAAIKERRQRLLEEVRGNVARLRGESYAALSGATHDSADESVADVIGDLTGAELARDVQEMNELGAAAQRIAQGTYGTCTECNDAMNPERLFAQPGAPRCLPCQQRYEHSHPSQRPTL